MSQLLQLTMMVVQDTNKRNNKRQQTNNNFSNDNRTTNKDTLTIQRTLKPYIWLEQLTRLRTCSYKSSYEYNYNNYKLKICLDSTTTCCKIFMCEKWLEHLTAQTA